MKLNKEINIITNSFSYRFKALYASIDTLHLRSISRKRLQRIPFDCLESLCNNLHCCLCKIIGSLCTIEP